MRWEARNPEHPVIQYILMQTIKGCEPGLAGFEDQQDGYIGKAAEPEVVYEIGKK